MSNGVIDLKSTEEKMCRRQFLKIFIYRRFAFYDKIVILINLWAV